MKKNKEESFPQWLRRIQNINNPLFKMWRMENRLLIRGIGILNKQKQLT